MKILECCLLRTFVLGCVILHEIIKKANIKVRKKNKNCYEQCVIINYYCVLKIEIKCVALIYIQLYYIL